MTGQEGENTRVRLQGGKGKETWRGGKGRQGVTVSEREGRGRGLYRVEGKRMTSRRGVKWSKINGVVEGVGGWEIGGVWGGV